jgi:hypothetical protein
MKLKKAIRLFHMGLILIGILLTGVGSHSTDSDWLLKPPGLRPLKAPATVIPATHQYVNRKLELPPYRSAAGTPLAGWSRTYIKTRRFSSDQSAWVYYRQSDLKQTKVINNDGLPALLRIWPVGSTLILEGYKGNALHRIDAELIEIEVMTKMDSAPISATEAFFPMDWSYARYTPEGNWSLSRQKLIECHQCHSIAFRLTGDLVFTQFP